MGCYIENGACPARKEGGAPVTGIRYRVLEPDPCDKQMAVLGSDSYTFSVARSDLLDPEALPVRA